MLRVAGLPAAVTEQLRCPGAGRWAADVVAAEESLGRAAGHLSDLLHEAVAATDPAPGGEGAAQRRELLALRRRIHNNKLPADPVRALDLVAAAHPPAAAPVREWIAARQQLEARYAEGPGLLDDELAASRAALRDLLDDERLRGGLLLASPALDGQLDGYAKSGPRPSGRMRKVERSVVQYLYRTALKTSPFSTFTGVATGSFATDSSATDSSATGSFVAGEAAATDGPPVVRMEEEWTSHVRINVVVLARLAELILARPEFRRDLPLRLASGWGRDEDRVRYVRRWITAGDDAAAVTFDAVKDRLFFLRRSGTLDRLIALLEERTELRHHELAAWLTTEHEADAEGGEAYLAALLQLGIVRVPCLDTEVHSGDPLRAFSRALAGLGTAWAARLVTLLDEPAALLDRYPAADRAERAALLRGLRASLGNVQRELGAAEDSVLPQTLLYEDVSAGTDVHCTPPTWAQGDGGSMRRVESVLPAFDLTLPQRITFEGFFTARYGTGGRCEDLLGLVHDFHEDFFDQYLSFTARRTPISSEGEYVPEENWLGLSGIKALDAARRAFISRMRTAWAAHPPGAPELRLDADALAEVAGQLTAVTPSFAPRCHHIQLVRDPAAGTELTVLNRSYGGLSFPFSRFTHAYEQAPVPLGDELRATAARITPNGAVLAEVTGGPVTTNLNLHGRLTDYQIVCPGETGSVPEDRQLHLDDLYAEHDPGAGRVLLRSRRLGREVVPVYLGYLVPLALPAIARTLLLLSPSSMSPLDVWAGVPEGAEHEGVTARPRVVHEDIVLSRRSWTTTAGRLPAAAPGATEAERFLAWQRWRHRHGLPCEVFATVSAGPAAVGAKPQYVDFDGPLSLAAFETLLGNPEHRVVLREVLPAHGALHVRSGRGAHVAELAVETFTSREPKGAL
ncbi:lantibiotic dehydratase [Streptomyces sp. NA04227]|uniref:lantibiotic dehydratase n=1 Tax=Streptomyces sp. NA04227 TaxID=2742136 RepID=UPI0020CA63E0|nr:lantibiotic dehydratase [Streptomyces sp. NA04227]